jgi:hypothetical protein
VITSTRQTAARAEQSQPPADLCREAIARLKQARQEQPRHLSEDVDEAERAIVRLRDELIDRLRREGAARTREALKHVNAALSLVVGVEYPAAGIQRKLLDQASTALHELLESGSLDGDDEQRPRAKG